VHNGKTKNNSNHPREAKSTTETKARACQTTTARAQGRPSGKDFNDSQKFQYHKAEANKAFKQGDIVKSSNHLAAMRHAGKRLHEQAEWAKKNKPR